MFTFPIGTMKRAASTSSASAAQRSAQSWISCAETHALPVYTEKFQNLSVPAISGRHHLFVERKCPASKTSSGTWIGNYGGSKLKRRQSYRIEMYWNGERRLFGERNFTFATNGDSRRENMHHRHQLPPGSTVNAWTSTPRAHKPMQRKHSRRCCWHNNGFNSTGTTRAHKPMQHKHKHSRFNSSNSSSQFNCRLNCCLCCHLCLCRHLFAHSSHPSHHHCQP